MGPCFLYFLTLYHRLKFEAALRSVMNQLDLSGEEWDDDYEYKKIHGLLKKP